jgi:hypothetical protein
MRIFVAVEDDLSLAFARRLIAEQPTLEIFREKVCGGFGALKRDIRKFDNMAKNGVPVFLITDLDNGRCPSQLTLEWLGSMPHPSLVFRVAVREIEAWLLAHPDPIAREFKISTTEFGQFPDDITDPKAMLLRLAGRAPRNIRVGMQPKPGSTARIGPEYNAILSELVAADWDPKIASLRSPSLARTRKSLQRLAQCS